MFTTRKANRAVQLTAVGLFSMTAVGAWAGDVCTAAPAYEGSLMGQLEVTAPKIRLADAGHMIVEASREVVQLGAMTVTATRVATFAERDAQNDSSGDSQARNRSPRAVLVQ
jgi:hypothetical protein